MSGKPIRGAFDQPISAGPTTAVGEGLGDEIPRKIDLVSLVHMVINTRADRREFFSSSLFSDSAWDILLELFAASLEGRQLSMTAVGLGPGIPTTTVLRWSAVLSQEGLITRREDPMDRRRTFLDLSPEGFDTMMRYFEVLERKIAARSTFVSPLLPRNLSSSSWSAAAGDEG